MGPYHPTPLTAHNALGGIKKRTSGESIGVIRLAAKGLIFLPMPRPRTRSTLARRSMMWLTSHFPFLEPQHGP